ncbi:MAG: hypothetical protein KJ072_27840, partial [Verrucomicrobia bacterium]|nr:hypothetical protein [Verrucomicrobiota bacterium]
MDHSLLQSCFKELPAATRARLEEAVARIVAAKERGGKVVVVTGSGPNLHEGVTTLMAELMRVGLVDGVTTSSAVVAHEMGGTLDRVKRCPGESLGLPPALLPRGGEFELTLMDDEAIRAIGRQIAIDWGLIDKLKR